jgi:hypothetical protein
MKPCHATSAGRSAFLEVSMTSQYRYIYFTFNSCQDIDGLLNGKAFRIDAYDAANDFYDTTIGFTACRLRTNYDVS